MLTVGNFPATVPEGCEIGQYLDNTRASVESRTALPANRIELVGNSAQLLVPMCFFLMDFGLLTARRNSLRSRERQYFVTTKLRYPRNQSRNLLQYIWPVWNDGATWCAAWHGEISTVSKAAYNV